MAKTLRLESTAPFQGLPELVAYDEGLFAAEGLEVKWIKRGQNAPKAVDQSITSWAEISPFLSHGSSVESGDVDKAAMYNACEWGNYKRVEETKEDARQLGRRAIVVYGALIVPPWSAVFTPQQLANKTVALPYFAGTHYLGLLMLEGFLPREAIRTCLGPNGIEPVYKAMMNGEVDATVVVEPYITVAEKAGCRIICMAPYHGTEVATDEVDADTYGRFTRAVHEAVRRIGADKRKYMQYFINHYRWDPEVAALTVDDLPPGRLQVAEPSPIPPEEMERTRQWMISWDLLQPQTTADRLVDLGRQETSHKQP